jgi:hypothetical protein
MKKRSYLRFALALLACAALATFLFVDRHEAKAAAPAQAGDLFIEFHGPWAFAPDPLDANRIVAIAPRTAEHRDLFVQTSDRLKLDSGVYELALPTHNGAGAAIADPSIAQVDIDPQSLQRALDSKAGRYVIRLPKPEEYGVAERRRSRIGAAYPPDASTERDYATAVTLRYNVSSLNGFSLAGSPDEGAFSPSLLRVETTTIHFMIVPTRRDDPMDKCDTHSRESFRGLTTLLGLTLYVDFPDNPADCHSKDPQRVRSAKADADSSIDRLVALLTGNLADVQGASVTKGPQSIAYYLAAAMYFFAEPGYDCVSPHIILRPTS